MNRINSYGRTIVIGLGNPILGDDGIGWRIIEAAQDSVKDFDESFDFNCLAVGGFRLMEHMIGYNKAIIVDAIYTGKHSVGSILCFPYIDGFEPQCKHVGSIHDVSLSVAIQVGRSLGAAMPGQIIILAIEIRPENTFRQELSEPVANAFPIAVTKLQELLQGDQL